MTDLDLNGVLFVCFPTSQTMAESRDRLELEITFAAMEDGADDETVCISPYWVQRTLYKRVTDAYKAMSRQERYEARKAARAEFLANRRKPTETKAN